MDPKVFKVPSPILTTNLPKSRSSIGSSPRSGLQEERYEQLQREFSDLDRDGNNVLTFDEICDFLSERQGEAFDLNLCKDLFYRMDRNHDNEITLEEFVESYIEVEDMIVNQIKRVGKEIKKITSKLDESKEKLKKAEQTEVLGSNGIMYGSVLVVDVISAQNLTPSNAAGLADPYVIIECAGKTIKTSEIPGSLNPMWNETFSIPISSKGLECKFTIMSKSLFGDKFVGKLLVPLSTLTDQLEHEQYFALQAENSSEKWQGRIRLKLQWIWSKVKYLKDINKELEKIISEDKSRLDHLKVKLDQLGKPFGYLRDLNSPDITTPVSATFNLEDKFVQKLEEITNGKISIIAEHEDYLYISLVIYMILAVIICFNRTDFVNCTTSLIGLFFWVRNEHLELKRFTYCLFLSQIYDFLWLVYYARDWSAIGGKKAITVWVSFVLFLCKLPMGIIFWRKSRFYHSESR